MLKRSSEIITVIQHGEKVIEAINRWSMVLRFVNPGMERINTVVSPDISIIGLVQGRWVLFIVSIICVFIVVIIFTGFIVVIFFTGFSFFTGSSVSTGSSFFIGVSFVIVFIVVIETAISLIVENDPDRIGKVKEGKYQLRNTTGKGPVKASTTWLGKFVEVIIKIT